MNLKKTFILLFLISFSWPIFALVPLESILLGDFSDQYRDKETDPIEYIFSTIRSSTEVGSKDFEHRRKLALYRGFFEEGQNLKNLCKVKPKVQYSVDWDRRKVVRSLLATLQYCIARRWMESAYYSQKNYKNTAVSKRCWPSPCGSLHIQLLLYVVLNSHF